MRCYDVDGIEMDVQDPGLFIEEENLVECKKSLEEMLVDYINQDIYITKA